jgi:Secretion system C-terminal sorting domain
MKKIIISMLLLVSLTLTAKATDILLSQTGNPQMNGLYKASVDINGAASFVKNTDLSSFRIARFKTPSNQDGFSFSGWLISDANGKEYFAINGDNKLPPADGWDVARAGVGLNSNFTMTFRDETAKNPTAFTLANTPATQISIYPNPTIGEINVSADVPIERLILTNLAGQTLLNEQNSRLNLSDFPTGTYFLTIQTATGKSVRKIIKQ